jgi:hypothetical protein
VGDAHAVVVNTTVDGVQRLLAAWLGVVVAELIVSHGASPAIASTAPAAGQGGQAAGSTGQPAANSSTATTGHTAVTVAGNAIATKLAIAAIASAAVLGGGVAVYRAQTRPAEPVGDVRPADSPMTAALPAAVADADATLGLNAIAAPAVAPADAALGSDAIAAPAVAPADAALGSDAIAAPAGPAPPPTSPPPADAALAIDAAGPVPLPTPAAPVRPRAPSSAPAPPAGHVMLAPTLNPAGPVTVYRSRSYGGTDQTVAFVVPPQPGASGPEHLISSGVIQPSKLTVSARDRATARPGRPGRSRCAASSPRRAATTR